MSNRPHGVGRDWVLDYAADYDIDQGRVESVLTAIFGRYRFFVRVRRRYKGKIWVGLTSKARWRRVSILDPKETHSSKYSNLDLVIIHSLDGRLTLWVRRTTLTTSAMREISTELR